MSWFKKIFDCSYQGSSQGLSQEPKVYYKKEKSETDSNETESFILESKKWIM